MKTTKRNILVGALYSLGIGACGFMSYLIGREHGASEAYDDCSSIITDMVEGLNEQFPEGNETNIVE